MWNGNRRSLELVVFIFLFVFISLFNIHFVSSQNISLTIPEEVNENEEFTLSLKLIDFPSDNYDVKIDLLGDGKRVAKILNNGEWKSTYYYINDAINNGEEKEFRFKVENFNGDVSIDVKIRNSKDSTKSFSGYEISVIGVEENSGENNNDNEKDSNKDNKVTEEVDNQIDDDQDASNNRNNDEDKLSNVINSSETSASSSSKLSGEVVETIRLNSETKNIKSTENFLKSGKTNNYAFYGLIMFCFLLALLFMLNKIKRKNEGVI